MSLDEEDHAANAELEETKLRAQRMLNEDALTLFRRRVETYTNFDDPQIQSLITMAFAAMGVIAFAFLLISMHSVAWATFLVPILAIQLVLWPFIIHLYRKSASSNRSVSSS